METSHLRVHENLQSDATSFFEDLRTRGFALVRMRAQTVHAVQRGWKLCGKDHGRVTYDSLLEFGYSGRVEAVNKAFFAVKCAQPLAMLPWPNDEFRDDAVELFGALDAEARWILERIGSCLRVEWSKFFEMLDEIPLSCNEISTSFMHLFDYLPQVSHGSETCSAHTDSGLVVRDFFCFFFLLLCC
jgi:isopenicillin N synthase-like dioxygenase